MDEHGFRRIALGMKGAVEAEHMGHPDFRVGSRIFATLHHGRAFGAVMLTPEQQTEFLSGYPTAFRPASGAWGRAGSTIVRLDAIDEDPLGEALTLAWRNAVAKGPTRSPTAKRSRKRQA